MSSCAPWRSLPVSSGIVQLSPPESLPPPEGLSEDDESGARSTMVFVCVTVAPLPELPSLPQAPIPTASALSAPITSRRSSRLIPADPPKVRLLDGGAVYSERPHRVSTCFVHSHASLMAGIGASPLLLVRAIHPNRGCATPKVTPSVE